jgi:spore germination protein KB
VAQVERISLAQVWMLIVISRLSLTLVYYGTPPGVRHDVWWQSFFSVLMALPFLWLLTRLWKRFPDQTVFQVAETVLGKVAGKFVSLLYLQFLLLVLALNLRLVGEFFLYAFLPRTPIIVIIGMVSALAAWASRAGIEVIGRAGQVVFPLLWPLQILKTGPLPHLQDMVSVAARTVELSWICILVPFVNDRHRLFGAGVRAQLWQGVLWTFMSITIIGVLGQDIEPHYFPFFAAARLVQVADFLERIDSLFLAVWLFGMFLRVSVLLWSTALGTAQLLGLPEYRSLVLPLAGIAISLSIIEAETFTELRGYLDPEIFTPYGLLFILVIPLLLLLVAKVRGRRQATPSPPPPWQPPVGAVGEGAPPWRPPV